MKALTQIKTKNELIGELIGLLQAPIQRVLGALQNKDAASAAAEAPAAEAVVEAAPVAEVVAEAAPAAEAVVETPVAEAPAAEAPATPEA